MGNRWRLSTLVAVLWARWSAGSFAVADEIRFALGLAEAQSVPTNSDYQARIWPRIDHGSPDPPEPTITLLRSEDSGRFWQSLRTLPPQAKTPQFALRHHQDRLYLTWADASILVFDAQGEWLETIDTGYDSLTDLIVVSGSTLLATVFRSGATHRLIRSIDGGRTWRESAKILGLMSSIKRRVRPPENERDRLLMNDRILEIEHASRR